jgi:hypothetical protein
MPHTGHVQIGAGRLGRDVGRAGYRGRWISPNAIDRGAVSPTVGSGRGGFVGAEYRPDVGPDGEQPRLVGDLARGLGRRRQPARPVSPRVRVEEGDIGRDHLVQHLRSGEDVENVVHFGGPQGLWPVMGSQVEIGGGGRNGGVETPLRNEERAAIGRDLRHWIERFETVEECPVQRDFRPGECHRDRRVIGGGEAGQDRLLGQETRIGLARGGDGVPQGNGVESIAASRGGGGDKTALAPADEKEVIGGDAVQTLQVGDGGQASAICPSKVVSA